MKKLFSLSLLHIMLVTSCSNNTNINFVQEQQISYKKSFTKSILGRVDWGQGFETKATLADIAPYGTVSLIYPHNHPTLANRTIGTGVTDAVGSFILNLGSFTPIPNELYVLEVTKRIGGVNNNLMSLRTFIKWSSIQGKWLSMTTNSVLINRKTTALALMTNAENFDPDKTIGTINNSTNPSNPTDITFIPVRTVFQGTNTSFQDHIFIVNSDGSSTSPAQISGSSSTNQNPITSPDGSKVVFVGNDGVTNQIYIANTTPPYNPVKISTGTSTNNLSPSFSPDSSKVVFVGTSGGTGHIFLIESNGVGGYNAPVQISSGTTVNNTPSFSPDNSKIVYVGRDTTPNIFVANSTSPYNPVKVSTGTSINNSTPSFSPDSSKVVFVGRDSTLATNEVYITNVISPTPILRSNNSAVTVCALPSFSPNGSKIVFRGTEAGVQHIYLANVGDNTTPDKITTTTTVNTNPIFAPDGNKIAFTCSDPTASQIYTVTTTPTYTLTKINGVSTSNSTPIFSPDSSKIAFKGTVGSDTNIYMANSDGSGTPNALTSTTTTTNNITPYFAKEIKITATQVNTVSDIISNVLTANYDPVRYIAKQGNNYVATNP